MVLRKILLAVSIGINLLLVCGLIWGEQGIIAYHKLKRDYVMLDLRTKDFEDKNRQLSKEIRLLQGDNDYIEKMIRKHLSYVRDNEILYIFPQKEERVGAKADEAKD